jgi:penicillin-binding protein 1A
MCVLVLLGRLGFEVAALVVRPYLPEVADTERFSRQVWLTSRVTDRDGLVLAEFYKERRTLVALSDLPRHLVDAVVAAEDGDFFGHRGVDWLAVARAAFKGALNRRFTQGGSTITQQLARNLYLSRARTLSRKVHEALLARKLEHTLTKDQILFQYLNLVYWGHGSYGVEEASRFYFGKGAARVDLGEAAMLAGILSAPEKLSPLSSAEVAQERMGHVLSRMAEEGLLDGPAEEVPFPAIVGSRPSALQLSPYGVDAALVEVGPAVDGEELATGGYRITTSLDERMQEAVNAGVDAMWPELAPGLVLSSGRPSSLCTCLKDAVLTPGCPVWARVLSDRTPDGRLVDLLGRVGVLPDVALAAVERAGGKRVELADGTWVKVLSTTEVALGSPWLTEETVVTPVVVPQVAVVLLDAASGRVGALYGGLDHDQHPFNRALAARPICSTVKPFLVLAAMQELGYGMDSRVDATPLTLPGAAGTPWHVSDAHPHGETLSLADTLVYSSNTVSVRLLREMTVPVFLRVWAEWGLPGTPAEDLSAALGNVELSPIDLARAYAFLATGRCVGRASVVRSLQDRSGVEIPLPDSGCTQVRPATGATEVRAALTDAVRRGTGEKAAVRGLQVAGKTGTGSGGRDAWFAGMVGSDVLVVWVGSDDGTQLPDNRGPLTAARVFHEVASRLYPGTSR